MVARALRSVSIPALPSVDPRALRRAALIAGAVALLLVGWVWLRDSPLVAVNDVDVIGAGGPQTAGITEALESAARDQTTLHMSEAELLKSVAAFPIVHAVHAKRDFPHGMTITVVQYAPVANIVSGGSRVAVAGDGTLLRGAYATNIPTISLKSPPGGDSVTDAHTKAEVEVLASAPAALRAKVAKVFMGPRGLSLRMRTGSALYFGSAARMRAKWAAATAVFADPSSRGATNVDVRVPELPTAGGLEQIAAQESPTGADPASTTGATGAAGTTP